MEESKLFRVLSQISQDLNLYLGGDFLIFLIAKHRKVEKIHFFSQEKLKKNEYEKFIANLFRNSNIDFEFSIILSDLIHLRAEKFSIYIIYHPYKIWKELSINEMSGEKIDLGIKSLSLEDSVCVKINMLINSQDKKETIENALDLFFGIENMKITQKELGRIYEFKYGIKFCETISDIKQRIWEISEYEMNFEDLGIEFMQRKIPKKELADALNKYFSQVLKDYSI
jgi:hypothetical protein